MLQTYEMILCKNFHMDQYERNNGYLQLQLQIFIKKF